MSVEEVGEPGEHPQRHGGEHAKPLAPRESDPKREATVLTSVLTQYQQHFLSFLST